MTVQSGEEVQTVTGSTMSPRQIRILKIIVIVMGLMLIAGFALVILTIVYQASQLSKKPKAGSAAIATTGNPEITLPVRTGTEVRSLDLDGETLAIHLKGPGGNEISVIDLRTGKVIRRIHLKPE
jgi:hypothetical protein